MKVRLQLTDRFEIEVEGASLKEIFPVLSEAGEVIADRECGQCHSTDIRPRTRVSTAKEGRNKGKNFIYHEMICGQCGSFLELGQHNEGGTLFPKRKIDNGKGEMIYDNQHRGWKRPMYRKEAEDEQ